jgi:hypothetical protein
LKEQKAGKANINIEVGSAYLEEIKMRISIVLGSALLVYQQGGHLSL